MNIQLEDIMYRLPNDKLYAGSANMDREGGGVLIQEDYFKSKEFKKDFVKNVVRNYPDELIEIILQDGIFSNSIDGFNLVLKRVNDVGLFIRNICDDVSICYIEQDKLTKYFDSGYFEELDCKYTKIIFVKAI